MCVAIPALVTAVDAVTGQAEARTGTEVRRIDLSLTPEVAVGDWVVAHSGFAVRRISPGDADLIFGVLGLDGAA